MRGDRPYRCTNIRTGTMLERDGVAIIGSDKENVLGPQQYHLVAHAVGGRRYVE